VTWLEGWRQAEAEARRRWGRAGKAWEADGLLVALGEKRFQVGYKPNLGRGRIGQRYYVKLGEGSTWAEAFAAADAYLAAHPEARP
jgi:hypothetical protein